MQPQTGNAATGCGHSSCNLFKLKSSGRRKVVASTFRSQPRSLANAVCYVTRDRWQKIRYIAGESHRGPVSVLLLPRTPPRERNSPALLGVVDLPPRPPERRWRSPRNEGRRTDGRKVAAGPKPTDRRPVFFPSSLFLVRVAPLAAVSVPGRSEIRDLAPRRCRSCQNQLIVALYVHFNSERPGQKPSTNSWKNPQGSTDLISSLRFPNCSDPFAIALDKDFSKIVWCFGYL